MCLYPHSGGQRVVSVDCSRDLPLGVVCSRGKDEMTVTLLEVHAFPVLWTPCEV